MLDCFCFRTRQKCKKIWYLKFENGGCPCQEFNAKAPKTYEEKQINQLKSVKAKGLKRGFKKIIKKTNKSK